MTNALKCPECGMMMLCTGEEIVEVVEMPGSEDWTLHAEEHYWDRYVCRCGQEAYLRDSNRREEKLAEVRNLVVREEGGC